MDAAIILLLTYSIGFLTGFTLTRDVTLPERPSHWELQEQLQKGKKDKCSID